MMLELQPDVLLIHPEGQATGHLHQWNRLLTEGSTGLCE